MMMTEPADRFPSSVLVVDDEPVVLQVLSRALTDKGVSTRTAATSEEALSLLRIWIHRRDELHRHRAIEERVVREVDLSHRAAADGPDQAIAVERLERRGDGLGGGAHLRKRP